MARYDTQLADERGAVRADQHRTFRRGARYGRDFDPRETTYFRPPQELRGYRGGSAGSYGFGEDYDRAYRGTRRRSPAPRGVGRRPDWEAERRDSYWGDRYGLRRGGRGGYDRER